MQIPDFSSDQRVGGAGGAAPSRHIAAKVGTAVAALLIAPMLLTGVPSARAETGLDGYARCVGGDTKPPPPGVSADVWFPSVHVIQTDLDSGVPSAQIVQILIGMGVKPEDAATRVHCFLANQPRGQGY
nr:hypothetical protein [Mycobacterium sherrisii]